MGRVLIHRFLSIYGMVPVNLLGFGFLFSKKSLHRPLNSSDAHTIDVMSLAVIMFSRVFHIFFDNYFLILHGLTTL